MPRGRFGSGGFHRTGIGSGKGVDMVAISLVEAAEGIFPQGTVGGSLQQNVVGAGDFMRLSCTIFYAVEGQVGILQACLLYTSRCV